MDPLELLQLNLLSPVVLAFALGIAAQLLRSDLRVPDALYQSLAIYLLLAIGLKGGAALSVTPLAEFALPAVATIGLGLAIPAWSYLVLRRMRFGIADAAALAAHYGSVSAVTFVAATTFAEYAGTPPEGYLPALVALLEVPAIALALLVARRALASSGRESAGEPLSEALREVLSGKSVLLLIGGVAIGWICGKQGLAKVEPFFVAPFEGALALFLLDMGIAAARRFRDLKRAGLRLLVFALAAPVVHGLIGVVVGDAVGLSVGGTAVFAALVASASYIAAPAAVRVALPEADPGLYLTGALVITFPFNLTLGIPLFHAAAEWLR